MADARVMPELVGRWNIREAAVTARAPTPFSALADVEASVLDRAVTLIDEQRAQIVELRAQRDVLISTLSRFTADALMVVHKPAVPGERSCASCGTGFVPRVKHGKDCDACKVVKRNQRTNRWLAAKRAREKTGSES